MLKTCVESKWFLYDADQHTTLCPLCIDYAEPGGGSSNFAVTGIIVGILLAILVVVAVVLTIVIIR